MIDGELVRAEARIPFGAGWHLYTRWVGNDRSKVPLLCVHGGPGAVSHDGFEPLERIASDGRIVIFFDQLGCGRSSRPKDPALWSNDLVIAQIDAVRAALDLTDVVVLGHSYGGWVTQEYALGRPRGLQGIVLADTSPDADMYLDEGRRIRRTLPADVQLVLDRHEAAGTTEDPEYAAAYQVYLDQFTCTIRPLPDSLARARAGGNAEIARVMWGPGGRSFEMNGRLKGWSVLHRLPDLDVPALVITGSRDMASPALARTMAAAIPDSRCVVIEGGSHTPYHEEPEEFCAHVTAFMNELVIGGPPNPGGVPGRRVAGRNDGQGRRAPSPTTP